MGQTIHLRVNGVSQDVPQERHGVRNLQDHEQVLQAAARYLKLPPDTLHDYVVDQSPDHLVVRPPAVYG
ncbi:MAG: hypothetical protein ACYCW6_22050 [Candidatus Xenobia bacterium]